MMADYWELNKVILTTPLIHSAIPTIVTTQDTLFMVLEVFHAVLGLANSFSSTFLAAESQD